MSRKLYKPLYCGSGEPSYYVECNVCGRAVSVSKYGIVKRHYKGNSKLICKQSGKFWK